MSIATRPDCLDREMLDLLEDLNQIKPVWVELGLQTIHPRTAEYIRRGYPPEVFDEAVRNLTARNLSVLVHLILGLPGETIEDMAASAKYVSDLLINEKKLCSLHSLSSTDSLSAMPADGQKSALSEPVASRDGQTIPSADGIKLQLLHVLKDTDLAADHDAGFFRTLSME